MSIINAVRRAWLRWCLSCNEAMCREYGCELRNNGLDDTSMLVEWRRQSGELRVQIARLESAR